MDATTTSLAEDLQDALVERTVTNPVKTTEELEKLTVDEQLNDIERAVYLLSSGQEVQRISVITNLPDLLRDNNAECMRRVVPKVREVLHVAQTDMQLAASAAFLQILQRELVPVQSYTQTFLQTILNSVDCKDPIVANAWLETLLDVIDLLPKSVIKQDILSIAVAKGQLTQSVQARLSCCKILGKIATKFESFVIKKEVLPVVQSLCQDVEYEVRGCMCQQLDHVARGLGLELTKSAILPELVELTKDEESSVRVVGLETVVNILSLLDEETRCSTIIPLILKFLTTALQQEDATLPVVAKQLGKISDSLKDSLTDEQRQWMVAYYKKLCKIGISDKSSSNNKDLEKEPKVGPHDEFDDSEDKYVETRKNAAFNFPAMVIFVGPKHFKSELLGSFSALCKDNHPVVRRTAASGFHEVVQLLGPATTCLQPDLINLLKDPVIEVLSAIMAHLSTTLNLLVTGGTGTVIESKLLTTSEVIPALLAAEAVIFSSNNWRLQEDFMHSLACLPKCCSSDVLYTKVIPVVYKKLLTARALPVRHAAAKTTLTIIRHLKKREQREEYIHRLKEDFCHGRSCHQRSLFIDICKYVMQFYSKAFFKEHFFEYVLDLRSDRVPNIRLRMCSLLPSLKRLVKLPYDRNLLQLLEGCIRKTLINEKDRDVLHEMKLAVDEMDKIHVQMETVFRRKNFEDDLEDTEKEEEEKRMIELEEKERKEEEARAAKGERKNSGPGKAKGDNGTSKIPGIKKGSKGGGVGPNKLDVPSKDPAKKTSGGSVGTSPKATGSSNKLGSKTVTRASSMNASPGSAGGVSRKGSAGTTPSGSVMARRGSLSSANSNSGEPTGSKAKSKSGNGPAVKKTSK